MPRFTRIRYTGFDAYGTRVAREVENYHARVVQHECDHLDGVLYPALIHYMSTFGFEEELTVEACTVRARAPARTGAISRGME